MKRTPLVKVYSMLLLVLWIAGCSSGKATGPSADMGNKAQEGNSGQPTQVEILISAAASLKTSLTELQTLYQKDHPEIHVTFNFGASGSLQKQIEQGAPADVFFSAGKKQMDTLINEKRVDKSSVHNILRNELVMVTPKGASQAPKTLEDLSRLEGQHIAVGEPASVPAGAYAKESLTKAGLWNSLQSKFVYAKDVRQVLTYVETGNAAAGFVYKSDALLSTKTDTALTLEPKSHSDIVYPAGLVSDTKHKAEAQAFIEFMQSKTASEIFLKNGFSLPEAASSTHG
ncbi:molybdate transport system substrate-binding protein [Paenibacillus shirakamiensis]|uniref:Molybdate transport system substrate-binding protein n=1 Tax=Paenibacillus shirakamiensis TaxID=1265935 RepID=A0ABS4JKE3_9BACL|nr:molybdate ABC transporter substrate-binding protein [Paenibacillus shirakamiensis]MBP2002172.1 molybdate transport system substrate-binding protein [Paenibacillus shirakamiensis]